jgi:hypothetical protein
MIDEIAPGQHSGCQPNSNTAPDPVMKRRTGSHDGPTGAKGEARQAQGQRNTGEAKRA